MRYRIIALTLFFCLMEVASGQISFNAGSSYRYLKGSEASSLPGDWMTSSYNDTGWDQNIAPFRYGDGTGGTVLSDMQNGYSTLYLRTSFNAFSTDRIKDIVLSTDYDDGFVIWINGLQVFSRNAPATLTSTSFAPGKS